MRKAWIGALIAGLLLGGLVWLTGGLSVSAEDVIYDHFTYLPLIFRPPPAVDLAVTLTSAPKPYAAGAPLTYTVGVTNLGPETARGLMATLTLPAVVLTPTYTVNTGSFTATTGAWTGVALTPGSRITLTVVGAAPAAFTGTLRSAVLITPTLARETDAANNTAQDYNFVALTAALLNPGFEGGHWWETHYGYQGNMPVPEHWVAWWNMDATQELGWPEIVRLIDWTENPVYIGPPARIRSGNRAFTMYRWGKYQGGLYQRVTDLPPGATATFSVYAHAWACNEDLPPALSCGEYLFWFKVGIDPTGGLDPWSPNVVWSEDAWYLDVYQQVGPVEAIVGDDGAITVFIFGQAKWPLKHNDAYWDDAALIVTP